MKEIITELLKNLGKYFWQTLLLTSITLFALSKTKYPTIFNLAETFSGLIKFIIGIVLLVSFWHIVCSFCTNLHLAINNKIFHYKETKKASNNLSIMLKNPQVYQNECYILKLLIENNINEFDIGILQKLFIIKDQNSRNTNILPNMNLEEINDFLFKETMNKALVSLYNLGILEYKNLQYYKIKDEIFNELVEANNGHSK